MTDNGPLEILAVTLTPTTLRPGELLFVNIQVRNKSAEVVQTMGPDPGFVYEEGESFRSRGFPEITGMFRAGIDFDGREGIDHPYRWGFGSPLAPGQTATTSGAIRLRTARTANYWAGMVHEWIAWEQDLAGMQAIRVGSSVSPSIVAVGLAPAALKIGDLLNVSIVVRNDSSDALPTQGPDPGFVYDEGDTFAARGFPDAGGNFRVGVDFADRSGIDHPYRWGLGAPLVPGETRTIAGSIRMKTMQAQEYWAGLVQEHVAWLQDREGIQRIAVGSGVGPRILAVGLAPAALKAGDLLTVSIVVKNDSSAALPTQGPEPGFVYDEGDTFVTRGFPDAGGNYRVGIDFAGRSGMDHPYRWGFGSPLAAGETRVISGSIRMKTVQGRDYWGGLVQEHIAWLQDREGIQLISVSDVSGGKRPRVVHVHSSAATTWNGQSDYWVFVNQNVVNDMVDRGLMALTGAPSLADAWRLLLPQYQPGQGIAIKVNNTNSGYKKRLDASIQTVNALVRGLEQIGVRHQDIWVLDATREFAEHYVSGCQYPGVQFFDNGKHVKSGFDGTDPSSFITFRPPAGIQPPPQIKLTDVLLNATYLINLPNFKCHLGGAGVTLGFKNHFGSIDLPAELHDFILPGAPKFHNEYNPLVDIYQNRNVGPKTVLTVGDGLFAGNTWDSLPLPMRIFDEKTPNSLFFAIDPVAIDCVMKDLLAAEWSFPPETDNYLRLASSAGLGVYERGDPLGSGYAMIEYQKIEA